MVNRIRIVSGDSTQEAAPPEEGQYRGFGTVPGETLENFHERMYDLPALEASLYEMEVLLAHG